MNSSTTQSKTTNYIVSISIIGALFFIFGFVTWLNGVLIPFLKTACELNDFQAYFVTFAFYISYFIMALPSSFILKKTGFKNGMSLGLWVMGIGALIFIPAAYTRNFGLFLVGLFIQGTGLSILQTASNPYITIIGPRESAAKRISIMGICNKLAGTIAPILLASIVLKDSIILDQALAQATDLLQKTALLDEMAQRVISPYVIMAIVLFLLGFMIRVVHLPNIDIDQEDEPETAGENHKKNVFQYPQLVFGVLALFFYVGVEVIAGDSIIRYGQSLGISIESAKYFTSLTLIGMMIGYIIGIASIPRLISQGNALVVCAFLGIAFSMAAIYTPSSLMIEIPFRDLLTFDSVKLTIPISALFIAMLGIANSLVWPAIWPLAIDGLGKFTKTASALLIMAITGGALLPLLYGKLAMSYNTQYAYWILVPGYLIILFYALIGHKYRSWNRR